jgi:hypothetical protein
MAAIDLMHACGCAVFLDRGGSLVSPVNSCDADVPGWVVGGLRTDFAAVRQACLPVTCDRCDRCGRAAASPLAGLCYASCDGAGGRC